ncbi:MAG: sulfatase-like hydrolase/transferase, partial [Pirellulaceae bacterium]
MSQPSIQERFGSVPPLPASSTDPSAVLKGRRENRIDVARRITVFAVATCLILSAQFLKVSSLKAESRTRPNIVLILADDMGYGDLGCYGGSLPTPNLDQFAREGMRFTQHYAGCTVCAPSRCTLLTGLHMGHCRVRGNGPGTLTDEDVTIAELMRDAGYATGCFGKWGVGNPPPADDPARNGFEQFYGYVDMFHAHNFYPEFLVRNGLREPLRNQLYERWTEPDGRGVAKLRADYAPE